MTTILVCGSSGQLGSELREIAEKHSTGNFNFIFTDKTELDISSESSVIEYFNQHQLSYCINCAAYTAVDKAESDTENAFKVNVAAVENLAKACQKNAVKFLHISTDYVYHNDQNIPFKEEDPTNPQSVYGRTKLEGESKAFEFCTNTIVIRTSWVYSKYGNNFVKTILKLGADRPELKVIFDQIGTPTYAADLADSILEIIKFDINNTGTSWKGIYHYSNEGVCSWYDFAKAIFEIKKIDCNVYPIETKDYPTPAKRPHFSLLNKSKIKSTFHISIPYWRESLVKCLKEL